MNKIFKLPEQTLPGYKAFCDKSVKPSLQLQVYVPLRLKHWAFSEQSWNLLSEHSSKSEKILIL